MIELWIGLIELRIGLIERGICLIELGICLIELEICLIELGTGLEIHGSWFSAMPCGTPWAGSAVPSAR